MDTRIICRTVTIFKRPKWSFQYCLHKPFMLFVLFCFFFFQIWKSEKRNITSQSQPSLSYTEGKARKDAFDIFEA